MWLLFVTTVVQCDKGYLPLGQEYTPFAQNSSMFSCLVPKQTKNFFRSHAIRNDNLSDTRNVHR